MCGIAGILGPRGSVVPRVDLEQMIGTLRHRGPDGFGYYQDGELGMAHARLAIIDLATGDQPMCNEDGSVWTVFNGEIFNYVELRHDLVQRGHKFKSASDTETIVHAYEEYGVDFVSRLNGQFAIALWDARSRRLVLARDRTGIRPLFYRHDHGRLLFGSEVKALAAASHEPLSFDPQGLAQVFTFWATVGAQTAFRGVLSLPPGHFLVIDGDGRQHLDRYWDWSYPAGGAERTIKYADAVDEVRALLADAVRLQLRADVPVGAYLSGGLDSSLLVALIRRNTDVPLRTFSVVFEDAEFDERTHQDMLVTHLRTDHTAVECRKADIAAAFRRLINHVETPILRTAPAPLMLLSEAVRRAGFKVVLTGEGADEVFAGYDIFKEARVRRFWARQPESTCRPQLLRRLYPYLKHSPTGNAYSSSFFAAGLTDRDDPFYGHRQRWDTTRRLWLVLSEDYKREFAKSEPEAALRAVLPRDFDKWGSLSRDQYVEAQTLLFGYLLSSQGDRVAMANSVEGRVPFLDHRLIELAAKLPPRFRLRGLTEKAILRSVAAELLPESIAKRVKQPYRAPDSQAFFASAAGEEMVNDALGSARVADAGYFDPAAVSRLVAKCRSGKAIGFADNMTFMGVLSTMLLHESYVSGAGAARSRSGNASSAIGI